MSSSKSHDQILQELNLLQIKYDEIKKELEQERSLNSSLQETMNVLREETKKKLEAEIALAESEKKYRLLVETSPIFIEIIDKNGDIKFINRVESGYTKEDIVGSSIYSHFDSKNGKIIRDDIDQAFSTNKSVKSKVVSLAGDYYISKLIKLNEDELLRLAIDISDLNHANLNFQESEERYRTLFESSPLGIAIIRQKKILFVNEFFKKMYGYDSKTDFANLPISTYQPPELVEKLAQRGLSREQGGIEPISYDSIGLKKDGTRFPIHVNVDQIQLQDGSAILGFFQDITERKEAEATLKENEAQFRFLFEKSNDTISITAPNGKLIKINQSGIDLFGYNLEEFQNLDPAVIYADSDDRTRFLDERGQKGYVRDMELKIKRKDGQIRDVITTSFPRYDKEGEVIEYQSILRDITDKKQADLRLQEEEEKFRKVTEATFEAIILSIDGKMIEANESFVKMWGYSNVHEMKGLTPFDLCTPESANLIMGKIKSNYELPYEWTGVKKDGSKFYLESVARNIQYRGQIARVTAMRDITERRNAEEKLKESEEKYRSLVEHSPNFIQIWDRNGNVKYTNIVQPDIKIEDFIGSNIFSYFDEKNGKKIRNSIEIAFSGDNKVEKEITSLPGNSYRAHFVTLNENEIMVIAVDITEIKRIEKELEEKIEALTQSEDRFRRLNEATYDGIVIHIEGRIEEANASFAKMFGYDTTEEIIGMYPSMFTTKESLELTMNKIKQKSQEPYEIKAIKKDGSQIDCLVVSKNCYFKGQEARITAFKDISLEKQADREIKNTLARFETLYNEAPISIVITRGTKYLFTNPAFCRLTGYEENELAGKDISMTQPPEQSQLIRNRIERRANGLDEPVSYEGVVVQKDGTHRHTHANVTEIILADGPATLVFVSDITEQYQAQIALEESEENFRNLVETSQDLIWKCDSEGRFTYLNPAWEQTHGYTIDEMLGNKFTDFQTPEVAERDLQEFGRHLAGGSVKGYQTTQIAKSGNEIELIFNAIPLFDEEGNIIGTQGTAYDITDRIKTEEKYRKLFELSPIPIVINHDQKFVEINDAAVKSMGSKKEDIIGKSVFDFAPPSSHGQIKERIRILDDTGEVPYQESKIIRQDGSIIDIERVSTKIDYEEKTATLTMYQDITERKKVQEKLMENEEKYRSLVETSQNLIWQCDTEGRFIYLNQAWEDLLEYQMHEMLGSKFTDFKDHAEAERSYQAYLKTLREEITLTGYESSYVSKSGQTKTLIFNAIPTKNLNGEVTGTQGTATDITLLIKREKEIQENLTRYQTLLDSAPIGILIHRDEEIRFVNPKFKELYKYQKDSSIIGKHVLDIIPHDRREFVIQRRKNREAGLDEPTSYESFGLRKDGSIIPIQVDIAVIELSEGPVSLSFIQDISDRKKAENALKESEQRYKGIVETQSEFIVRWLPDGIRTFVNDAYCKYYNITKEEAIGTSFFPLITEEYREHVKHRLNNLTMENPSSTGEHQVIRPDGNVGWNLWTDKAIFDTKGNVIEYQSVGLDITDLKQSKAALMAMEGQYRTLFESSPLGISVIRDRIILYANRSFSQIHGYSQDEIIGEPISRLQPLELVEMLEKRGLSRQAGGKEPTSYESTAMRKNGSVFPIHIDVTSINLTDGPAIMSFIRDTTEQKAAELNLIETQEKLQTVISNAPVILWALDSNGIFTLSEGNALSKLGLKAGQVVGQSVYTVYKDNQEIIESHKNVLNGIPGTMIYEVGDSFFESHLEPQYDNESNIVGMIGIALDITNIKLAKKELQATRDQLFQAQKMEAIGRIAGGIAHDFNNLLTLITLNSEVLISKIPRTDPIFANVRNIIDSVKTATALTSELLLFSRNRIMKPTIIQVNSVIEKYLSTFGHFIRGNIDQQVKLDPMVREIEIDPTHLDQALMNLIINAVDAMPDGGTLTIETKYIPSGTVKYHGELNNQNLVEISVEDTGIGMDETTQKRIFEPFFTTKEEGKGTGLGLATTYSIVEQSDGFIKVHSEVNHGSRMMLYIPIVDRKEDLEIEKVEISTEVIAKDQLILLVDDDESIREIIKNILMMSGFDVLDAGNAFEALRIYKENIDMITLIITDIIMPNVTGLELIDQIRETNSSIKVLFITGYTKNLQSLSDRTDSDTGFLQKPFDRDTLISKLDELINE
ncbi:MAG: PAS domain S-box protein [Candidatus Kariarchaeaceae archaeon]|jgi:PAS domain S-box-containing protein